MTLNTILLRRSHAMVVPGDLQNHGEPLLASFIASFNRNLEGLGYTLSGAVMEALKTLSVDAVENLYLETIGTLQEMRGVKNYAPMYPNFPKQVMEASAAELYVNAWIHYFSAAIGDVIGTTKTWLPKYTKDKRETLRDVIELKVIELGSADDVRDIITNLISSNTSISETDKADVRWYLNANPLYRLPDSIPNHENLATVMAMVVNDKSRSDESVIKQIVMPGTSLTATDVLRIAVAISGGDVSLAAVTKFISFSRSARRRLVMLLEYAALHTNAVEDMMRWQSRWIRLGERLHPGEFPKLELVQVAFQFVRGGADFLTWNRTLQGHINNGQILEAVKMLMQRPGEFARRLNHLLVLGANPEDVDYQLNIASAFGEVVEKVSTPVLLQALTFFEHRSNPADLRVFFPKGNTARLYATPNELPAISGQARLSIINHIMAALTTRFAKFPPLGKVFIDSRLDHYLVPFSQRSASKSLRTVPRGSQIQFGEGNTIRFFLWWKEKEGERADMDLSAVMYDGNWNFMEQIQMDLMEVRK